ncbi:putative uncharacterized protein DDB_G0282133 isoform X2 [Aphidius gifuensis]|uniref:putative uncharacterized protein DDB_G0282133 isoform X2 n=1 Tax=Aphidius gifuensis TaxID=684658 RepID=UPI001CDC7F38|nr:putative uncharacterized protein DDB_G0282133 isoform X2 [Aphidius gifuensis]
MNIRLQGTSTDLVPQLLGMFDELARKDQFNNNINDQIPSSIQKRLSLVAVNSQRNTIFGQICTGKMEQSQSSAMQQQQQQQQQQHQQQNHDINCIIPSLDKRSSPFSQLLLPSRRPPPPPPPPPLPPLPNNSSCSITSSTVSFLYPKVEITVSDNNNNNENEIKNLQNNNNNNEKNHTILNDNNSNNNNEDDIDNVDEDNNHEDDDNDDKNINKLTTPKYGGRRKNNNNNIVSNINNNNGNIDRPLSGSSISSSSTSSSGCSNQDTTRSVNPYLTSVESLADTCASSQGSGDSGVVTKSDTNCRIIDDNLIVSSSHITTMNSSPQFMFHRARYCDPQRNSVEKVLLEIVDTEAIYVEHIRQIIQGYLIYWRNNKITLLNDNELNNLFSNIEDIYKFNYKFLGEIENCGLDPVKVANIFIKNNSGFKVYTEYCTNYPRTVETLTNLMGHDDTANEFRERQASLCHALPLGSFLLKPVQRILKYHLLLESLSREYDTLKINNQNNQNNNINYDNDIYLKGQKSIDDALNGMMDIAKHINAMKRKHEHAVRVQEIQSLLYGWAGPDLTTYGELIAEGRFRMRGAKAPRHAFLFDKMLLLTKKKEDGLLVYKAHIMCSNLMLIESIPGEACSFHVIPFDNPRLQYTLQARNTEQKREWTLQIKRVMLENYNAVIPVHAQELVLQIGQNQNNNDNINTNFDKISMKKQYSSPPEYLERRKQDKERRRSEAGQKIKKLLKTETADNSPLSIRKLTIDNNDNDNNNNLHDKSLNRSLDSRSSKVKDRFTNWRRKSEPGFQSYISLNQSDDEHTDNNNNINNDIEVAIDALNYDDVIDNNDKQNDDDDDDDNNNKNKNNTKDTNEQINNNSSNNSSRTVEEIVGHILYMQNKEFQKLLEKQRNNSMTNNVRQQQRYNKNHNSIDTSDDSDNPETDISSINNSLLSINKQNNTKNIKRIIRKDKHLLKSNNCWNSLESSTNNKYNNLQKNNNDNTQIIDNNNIVNIKKNNVTEKKQLFESFKKQNIITDSKIIKTALRIRDNSLYDDDDDDDEEDEEEEDDDRDDDNNNNMTNSDLSLTNKSFGNYDNLENIWNNYDNKKQDTNSPTAIWLTKLCDDLPTSPQKCGSLPRSFQINPSSQMIITKRLLQRDGKPMSERPFTIASDKPAEINLEDMERYATTYQPKDIIAKFPLSSTSTITCSYSIDDNLTDANHMKVIETDIHPDHKIYRENNNNNKFKNVLTKAGNRLQVLRSTVSAETLEIIDDYNNTKLTKRNNNNNNKNKKNKFKLSRESSIDDIDETNLSTINLQHSSLYYKQGSSCLGARIAQSDYADPSVLFFDLKKINLSTNESTNSNNNIIEKKITTNANDKNDNSIDDVDVDVNKKINERNPSETDSFYERCFEKIENYADNIADTSYVVDADVDTDDVFRDSAIFSDIDDSNLIVKNNKTYNDNIIKIKTKITQPTPPPPPSVPIKIRKSKPCIARKPDNLKMKVKVIKKCELVPQCVRVKVSSTNQSQSGNVGKLINGGSVDEISAGQSQAGWVKKIVGQLQGQI